MTPIEQALREALEWALTDATARDAIPPPGIVMAYHGQRRVNDKPQGIRRLIINDAYLDGLRSKP